VASLAFLFNEGNSMWGGNIPSTLAGEFAFSLAFGLAVIFFGGIYRGIETGRGCRTLAVVLALAVLCHPVAFLNATVPPLFFLLAVGMVARLFGHVRAVALPALALAAGTVACVNNSVTYIPQWIK